MSHHLLLNAHNYYTFFLTNYMRTEKDTMGKMQVPDNAYYGAQTQRAIENFPISQKYLSESMINALAMEI